VTKKNGGKPAGSSPAEGAKERERPAHEVRIGRIRATVWRNHSDQHGAWYSVSITRAFKQGDQWKSAVTFGKDDLLVVAEVSRLAFHWVAQQLGGNGTEGNGGTPASDGEIPI
jgi:hypothetical protein